MFPEELSDFLVGNLVNRGLELDVFRIRPETIDHFEDDFHALDDYQDETSLKRMRKKPEFHNYSLGFYHSDHVIGQLPVIGPKKTFCKTKYAQPIYLRVLPEYHRQGLARAFIYTALENVLNNEPDVNYFEFFPRFEAREIIYKIVSEVDPMSVFRDWIDVDAGRARENLPGLKEKYDIRLTFKNQF